MGQIPNRFLEDLKLLYVHALVKRSHSGTFVYTILFILPYKPSWMNSFCSGMNYDRVRMLSDDFKTNSSQHFLLTCRNGMNSSKHFLLSSKHFLLTCKHVLNSDWVEHNSSEYDLNYFELHLNSSKHVLLTCKHFLNSDWVDLNYDWVDLNYDRFRMIIENVWMNSSNVWMLSFWNGMNSFWLKRNSSEHFLNYANFKRITDWINHKTSEDHLFYAHYFLNSSRFKLFKEKFELNSFLSWWKAYRIFAAGNKKARSQYCRPLQSPEKHVVLQILSFHWLR